MLLWDDPVGGNNTGTYSDKLLDVCNKIIDDETLLNLFDNMRGKGLYTRDIFSFVEKQADLRILHKNIDKPTADHALSAKIRDVKETLKAYKNTKAQLKKEYLKEVGGKKYKLRKLMSRISKTTSKRRDAREKVFTNKLNHYQTQQTNTRMNKRTNTSTHDRPFVPTPVPERLREFDSLPIFGTPDMLPKKQDPVGPFICDDNIKLDANETLFLCRDPKYSLILECEDNEMSVETERMLCKHRLNEHSTRQRHEKLSRVETICKDVGADVNVKKIDYDEVWKQEKHRYIYDPFCKEINFNDRRPTDYKLNKRTKLPKPLDLEGEFMCEIRKRSIFKAYEKYKSLSLRGNKLRKNGGSKNHQDGSNGDMKEILNLNPNEKKGLKSLLKRVKDDEIVITPTDKSGRFALLSLEQYVKAGNKHTDKDELITWSRLKYLRNQVNSHVWWISRIMGYSKNTDEDRMNNNLHVSGLDVPEMAILIKDHKKWSKGSGEVVPSRPVVSGNNTINTHLSEIISEIVEPLALESDGMEINSSEEALGLIDRLNTRVKAGTNSENVLSQLYSQDKMADNMAGVTSIMNNEIFNVSDLSSTGIEGQENQLLSLSEETSLLETLDSLIRSGHTGDNWAGNVSDEKVLDRTDNINIERVTESINPIQHGGGYIYPP